MMMMCLDVGNTHVFGGVFAGSQLKLRFRYPANQPITSDLFGLFLLNLLNQHAVTPGDIQAVSMCSVVPSLDYSIVAACKKYFALTPLELKPGVKTGLKLNIKNPLALGADRIANCVAAVDAFPEQHVIVVDFGTAPTICVVTAHKEYLGGAILPGFKLSMESLSNKASQLFAVDIIKPNSVLGKTTEGNIQTGLYYGQLGANKEIITRIKQEVFLDEKVVLISTGGYAHLFADQQLFDVELTDLVLDGLRLVLEKNHL